MRTWLIALPINSGGGNLSGSHRTGPSPYYSTGRSREGEHPVLPYSTTSASTTPSSFFLPESPCGGGGLPAAPP